jgi:glycine dehydrogenase
MAFRSVYFQAKRFINPQLNRSLRQLSHARCYSSPVAYSLDRTLSSDGQFKDRHIGPNDKEMEEMVGMLGFGTLDEFLEKVIPDQVRSNRTLNIDPPNGQTEMEVLDSLEKLAIQNDCEKKSLIGLGFHGTVTPSVILRNLLESPEWYTSYTPYQPEISQGS